MKLLFGLALACGAAHAGVVYDLTTRPLATPQTAPVVAHYTLADDQVRVDAADGSTGFIFKKQTIYILDNTARTVSVEKYATLLQVAAKATHNLKRLQDAASSAPPSQRTALDQAVRQTQELTDRQVQSVARIYQITARSETVDGHKCRIWEERESDAKRLELCVVPVARVLGGADVLRGMKMLSEYWRGATFALGVEFGPAPWWSGFDTIGGVPLLIREFKDGKAISETTLTAIRKSAPGAVLFEMPAAYTVQEQALGDP